MLVADHQAGRLGFRFPRVMEMVVHKSYITMTIASSNKSEIQVYSSTYTSSPGFFLVNCQNDNALFSLIKIHGKVWKGLNSSKSNELSGIEVSMNSNDAMHYKQAQRPVTKTFIFWIKILHESMALPPFHSQTFACGATILQPSLSPDSDTYFPFLNQDFTPINGTCPSSLFTHTCFHKIT